MKQAILIDAISLYNITHNLTEICTSSTAHPYMWVSGDVTKKLHVGDLVVVQPSDRTSKARAVWEVVDEASDIG